jgi:hypothetical protein
MKVPAAQPDLMEYLEAEVYPRLRAEDVYNHPCHNWKKGSDEWQGDCPWHDSKSKASFTVTPSKMEWYCRGCAVGGGPVNTSTGSRAARGASRARPGSSGSAASAGWPA